MLAYVIPLRSAVSTDRWDLVSEAFALTIRSFVNQSDQDFVCIVICHELPEGLPALKQMEVVHVDFEAPTDSSGYKKDKGSKLNIGLAKALEYEVDRIMVVDADDLISSRLTAFLNQSQSPHPYLVEHGYVWNGGSLLREHKRNFYKLCGSCYVADPEDIAKGIDYMDKGHHLVRENFEKEGRKLNTIPFPSVTKNVSYGGNISETQFIWGGSIQRSFKKLMMIRWMNKRIKNEFGF